MSQNLHRLAAEHNRSDAAAAMRCHRDQVATSRNRGVDNGLIGVLVLDLNGIAGYVHGSSLLSGGSEKLPRSRFGKFLVVRQRRDHPAGFRGEDVKGLGYSEQCQSGTKGLGKLRGLLDGCGGQG